MLFRISAAVLVGCVMIGCGGGGEQGGDNPEISPKFLSFSATNGNAIKDKNNENFYVRVSDRVFEDKNITLSGLTLSEDLSVFASGRLVGAVVLEKGSTGTQIAVLKCTNGSDMDIVVTGSTYRIEGC